MKLTAFDLHSHLYFEQFDTDREEILRTMEARGIGTITIGTSVETSKEALRLSNADLHRFACVGIHPHEAEHVHDDEIPDLMKEISSLAKSDGVVGIGETGLDYFRLPAGNELRAKQIQRALYVHQLQVAHSHGLPVMIHCRDAYDDLIGIYKETGLLLHLHFHFFTSSVHVARQCLDVDGSISFPGVITFVQACEEVVRYVPLERMMIETDAPFAAPVPYRGKRSDPTMVMEVAQAVARIKGIEVESVLQRTIQNTNMFFPKTSQ